VGEKRQPSSRDDKGGKPNPFQISVWAILGLSQVSSTWLVSQSLSDPVSYATSKALRRIQPPNIEKSQRSEKIKLERHDQKEQSDKPDFPENQKLKTSQS
jgi:hypothetical protein